jgi:hypothetical protein
MLEVLRATGGWASSNALFNLDNAQAIETLIAGRVDVVVISEPDIGSLERLVGAAEIRLMNVAQAEAIAEAVPSLKHVVLWRGLIDLSRDLPNSNVDLLAFRSRLLVRKDLHPALQYLLLEAMQEVHSTQGPFNTLRGFPSEHPSDLSLSLTAQAFYRSGPTLWQRYTSFWLSSLLNRIAFFIIPILVTLVPIIGFVLSFPRWLHMRRTIPSKRASRRHRPGISQMTSNKVETKVSMISPDSRRVPNILSELMTRRKHLSWRNDRASKRRGDLLFWDACTSTVVASMTTHGCDGR